MQACNSIKKVLIVGSSPNAVQIKAWDLSVFDAIVVINNAWRLTPDWHYHIHPEDFPQERWPTSLTSQQTVITHRDYVPAQNQYGGFVYAGGTMAFTAAYWALAVLKPQLMAFIGCDMVYSQNTSTHFYGTGTADPLRDDVTLQNLEAKAARLQLLAAEDNCLCVNLSTLEETRLTFPLLKIDDMSSIGQGYYQQTLLRNKNNVNKVLFQQAKASEKTLNYCISSGEYWKYSEQFDADELKRLDDLWLAALTANQH